MQDAAQRLRAFMNREGLSQETLAKKARVSQATVCRALKNESIRRGAARNRLFKYAKITEWMNYERSRKSRARVLLAFDRIWDRTDQHANAIARVIDALAEFRRPATKGQKSRRG